MVSHLRKLFWVEAVCALASLGALLLTLVAPTWIETVSGVDPDHHSGSTEWIVAGVLIAFSLTTAMLARTEWRRAWALSR